jgi:hypothetical protein
MDTTLIPKPTDPRRVLVARADEELAHVYEQITCAGEQIARAEEQLSKLEHDAARRGNRPPPGGRAVRGFTGLTLTACVCVAAFVWQSPSYGDAARQIVARWAPQFVPISSLTLESLPAQPSPPTVQAAAAETAPPQPAPLAQPEIVAPTATALSPELTQLLQSMARDLATVGQGIEQLKASQQQMARDNANAVEQLKASQEQMARVIARASDQNLGPKISAAPPRPTATTPTRKPVPTLPSPQATTQLQAENPQLSSAPRPPTPLR